MGIRKYAWGSRKPGRKPSYDPLAPLHPGFHEWAPYAFKCASRYMRVDDDRTYDIVMDALIYSAQTYKPGRIPYKSYLAMCVNFRIKQQASVKKRDERSKQWEMDRARRFNPQQEIEARENREELAEILRLAGLNGLESDILYLALSGMSTTSIGEVLKTGGSRETVRKRRVFIEGLLREAVSQRGWDEKAIGHIGSSRGRKSA